MPELVGRYEDIRKAVARHHAGEPFGLITSKFVGVRLSQTLRASLSI
jgi:hypothetical protein